MMAQMQFHDTAELIEQRGYITVNDPTCGGGAMLIAFAKVCQDKDVNYQRRQMSGRMRQDGGDHAPTGKTSAARAREKMIDRMRNGGTE
jgi:hypothetical protein